jgi:hypothetical protein
MGWKSTKTLTREIIIKKIEQELNNIEDLSDETLCDILETIGDDEKSKIYSGHNYVIGDEDK